MTTVLVRQNALKLAAAGIREYLRRRGSEASGFEPVAWLTEWLNDSAGCFWGRKIKVPVVGDVCRAKVESCEKQEGFWLAKGRIAETRCWVKATKQIDKDIKVKVAATTEGGVECVVAKEEDELSTLEAVAYRIYYTARGVTGVMEEVPWQQRVVRLARIVLNENLPASVLAGFERIDIPNQVRQQFEVCVLSANREDVSGYQFATTCDNCDGEGELECDACDGTGKKHSVCKICGGSGTAIHRNGKLGECWYCHGDGGSDYDCRACHGVGTQRCWICHGVGVRHVRCDYNMGRLSVMGRDKDQVTVCPDDVFLWRQADGRRVEMSGNWHKVVRIVRAAVDDSVSRAERSAALQAEARKIINGLETKIAHSDTTRLPPVHAVLLGASLKRAHGRVIYQLKECGESTWKKSHNEPYPPGTLLKIEGVDVPEGELIVYLGYSDRVLEVSFPKQINAGALKDRELEISSAEMKPPEVRQKEYLERWIEATDSPIYRAMVDGCMTSPAEIKSYFNKGIEQYERQRAAVGYGLSEAPLFLLKGPPGTGKTTIIVEIIRQAIHRGQRVLLTSQTHQAVENVLEKLHSLVESGEDKIIRMVHYTAQEGKASELAKLYRDGAGTAEVKSIKSYVAGYRSELGDNVSRHGETAVALLRQYCEEGAVCFGRIVKAKADQKAALDGLMSELQQKLAAVDAERAALLARLDSTVGKDIKNGEEKLNSKLHEKTALEKDIATLDALLQKKRKRAESLTDGSLGGKLMGAFAWLNKNYNADVVRKQIEVAEAKLLSAGAQKEALTGEIEEVGMVIAGHRQTFERQKDLIEHTILDKKLKASDDSHECIEKERAERDAGIAMSIASSAKKIAELNEFLGEETRLTVESPEADWTAVCQRVEEEWVREKEVHGFVVGWEKVLVDNPEAVVKYLNSQTNVFMATCVGVGGWRSLMDGTYDRRFEDVQGIKRKQFFDLVIVDEAGHATFAETVIPLSMGNRAILIGDDKQLPPMEDEELETYSLFTRLWEDRGCTVPRVMLDTQFRMHPEIANFVSDTFYNGELKSGVNVADRAFQFSSFNKPVCLLSTSNQPNHYEKWCQPSFTNELEATYVRGIIDALIEHCNEHGAKDESISVAVITPYAEQVSLIRSKLKGVFGNSGNVFISQEDVASVDKFQGGERDVVIASFVRSPRPKGYAPKLTFVQDLKRMNVAFSRPRKMLILVGDIEALSTQLGTEDGRKAFESFHRVVRESGLEILAWERKVSA